MTAHQSTKAQLEMTETLIVLIIFFIILIISIFFYYQYSIGNIREKGEDALTTSSSVLLSSISSLPDISCNKDNCIDIVKLLAFVDDNKDYPIFDKKTITIEQVYPQPTSDKLCTPILYQQMNFPLNCKKFILHKAIETQNKQIISTPISLYYPQNKQYGIGKLIIEVYP
ncbi:MAG: hypothetical protein V1815_01525 [Candidatus Woesearchaeota archaeon]